MSSNEVKSPGNWDLCSTSQSHSELVCGLDIGIPKVRILIPKFMQGTSRFDFELNQTLLFNIPLG